MWCTGLVDAQHVGSSWTRDQTCVPCVGRQTLNYWTTREVQWALLFKSSFRYTKLSGKCREFPDTPCPHLWGYCLKPQFPHLYNGGNNNLLLRYKSGDAWLPPCHKYLTRSGSFVLLPVALLMLTFVSGDRNALQRL